MTLSTCSFICLVLKHVWVICPYCTDHTLQTSPTQTYTLHTLQTITHHTDKHYKDKYILTRTYFVHADPRPRIHPLYGAPLEEGRVTLTVQCEAVIGAVHNEDYVQIPLNS